MKKEYLPRELLLSVDLEPGDQTNINHTDCPAGTDIKERLYIKRPEDNVNVVIGYCHNCQLSGITRLAPRRYKSPLKAEASEEEDEVVRFPSDAVFEPRLWPNHAYYWPCCYSVTPDMMRALGLAYVPSQDRILIPFGEPRIRYGAGIKSTNGYQLRRLVDNPNQPKYLTVRPKDKPIVPNILDSSERKESLVPIVLVEDALSAIRVYSAGYIGVSLSGTHMRKEDMFQLSKTYPYHSIVVWLDNDNKEVREHAAKIQDFLRLVHKKKVVRIRSNSDPKRYDQITIQKLVAGALRRNR